MRNCCAALRVVLFSLMLMLCGVAGCPPADPAGLGLPGPEGPEGPPGADGADGADGGRRVYGDGSAGALAVAVATSVDLSTLAPNGNLQFTNFTVNSGVLNIPSGAVIRCTGTFTNNSFINIRQRPGSGGPGYSLFSYGPPAVGIGGSQAGGGVQGDGSEPRGGGIGATGLLNLAVARGVLMPGVGGGGGAGSMTNSGGDGGGTIVILAQGGFVNGNLATLQADDETAGTGAGGGGGGIIIIASPISVVNNGAIFALGSRGGPSGAEAGPLSRGAGAGGGGGGGIVHLISPAITAGFINVAGGSAGTTGGALSVASTFRVGGGGGGAGGGSGGDGGVVFQNGTPDNASAGDDGFVIESPFDPTSLF